MPNMSFLNGLSAEQVLQAVEFNILEAMQNPVLPPWVQTVSMFSPADIAGYLVNDQGIEMRRSEEGEPKIMQTSEAMKPKIVQCQLYSGAVEIAESIAKNPNLAPIVAAQAQAGVSAMTSNLLGLLLNAIKNGDATTKAHDGVTVFNASRATGSNLFSIDISALPATVHGTTTNPSPEEFALAVMQAISGMRQIVNKAGVHVNEYMTGVTVLAPINMVGAVNRAMSENAMATAFSRLLSPGVDPALLSRYTGDTFSANYYTSPSFTEQDSFYIFRNDTGPKAFVHQQSLTEMDFLGLDSEFCRVYSKVVWMFKQRCGVDGWHHTVAAKVKLV